MNQEILLKATPSIARRLVRIAQISNTQIDDAITTLAGEGLVEPQDFDALPLKITDKQRKAVQNLLDYDLRAVLLSEMHDTARVTALCAAKLAGQLPITVVAQHKQRWEVYGEHLGFSCTRDPETAADILLIDRRELVKQEVIEPRRQGTLIWEAPDDQLADAFSGMSDNSRSVSGPMREFTRAIYIRNVGSVSKSLGGWGNTLDVIVSEAVTALFGGAPNDLLISKTSNLDVLKQRGFKRFRPQDYYFMFNVVNDLL